MIIITRYFGSSHSLMQVPLSLVKFYEKVVHNFFPIIMYNIAHKIRNNLLKILWISNNYYRLLKEILWQLLLIRTALYIYIYIYICVCVCVCIYIYICTHTLTHTYISSSSSSLYMEFLDSLLTSIFNIYYWWLVF